MKSNEILAYIKTNPLLFPVPMTDQQGEDVLELLAICRSKGVTSQRQTAYILATALVDADMALPTETLDAIIDGRATGHSMSEFFSDETTDWLGARAVVTSSMADAEMVAIKAAAFYAVVKRAAFELEAGAYVDDDPQGIGLA
jgi:hypothetical protein